MRVEVEKEHFHQNGKMCDFISSELNILAIANVIAWLLERKCLILMVRSIYQIRGSHEQDLFMKFRYDKLKENCLNFALNINFNLSRVFIF